MTTEFAHLYQKYIDNTCTPEEREAFLSMVAEASENDALEKLMDVTWDKMGKEQLIFPGAENILIEILSHQQEFVIKTIPWQRHISTIAAVLAMLVAGIYFYQKDTPKKLIIQTHTAAIQAGKNRATLTLADGSVIHLDNTSNEEIARQSGVKISKSAEGQLVYNVINDEEQNASAYNTISTPRGGQYQVNLPDGTKVWLNAASSLRYPVAFGKKQRKVELTGEAYFEVTSINTNNREAKVPFIVQTSKQEVKVLGTHFNINSYADEANTKTTLLEGAVSVKSFGPHPLSSILKPGQQAVLNGNNLTTSTVDIEEAVAWKNGYFQFNESDLGSIMRQLSRWYNVDVVFEGRSPNDLFHFRTSKGQELLEILKIFETNGIHLKIEGRKLIVKS